MLKERLFLVRFEEEESVSTESLVVRLKKLLTLHVTGFKPVNVIAIKTDWKKDENL